MASQWMRAKRLKIAKHGKRPRWSENPPEQMQPVVVITPEAVARCDDRRTRTKRVFDVRPSPMTRTVIRSFDNYSEAVAWCEVHLDSNARISAR